MIDVNLENKNYAGSVFIPGSPDDPRSAWAWCNTETGVVNRVVRYRDEIAKSFGCGWLGHAGHVLEIIPPNEVRHFQLDRERRFRVVYMLLRERYTVES